MKHLLIHSLIIFFCFFTTGVVLAEDLIPMPVPQKMSEKEFLAKTEPVDRVIEDDKTAEFKMRIPPEWQELTENDLKNHRGQGNRLLGDIAYFRGPSEVGERSYVSVEGFELNHELYLEHWVVQHILQASYTLRSMRKNDDGSIETLYVLFKDNKTYVARTKTVIKGPRILQVSYVMPYDRYEKERDMQAYIINDFSFSRKDTTPTEKLKTYAYLDQRKFEYPESLIIGGSDNVSEEELKLDFTLKDMDGFRKGAYNVAIYAREEGVDLKEKIQGLLDYYLENRLERRDRIEVKDYPVADFITFKSIEVYGMSIKTTDYETAEDKKEPITQELWMGVLADEKYYYIFSLVSPARDLDIYNWSRNARAFELMLTTLRDGMAY
ncbi:MAG: hypothetical protein CMH30_02105 [Micavibrio sp.]|nr:hypothetical protein [Micavibrio sp.]